MKNYMKSLIPLLFVAFLCGCASAGKNFDSGKVSEIHKGETTEADLVRMFGPPIQRGINSETGLTLTWVYSEARVKGETFIPFAGAFVGGATTKTKTLLINLDQDGKVASFSYSGGDMESRSGIPNDPENPHPTAAVKSPKGS